MGTIYFANAVQVALFECELKGQISDGMWENTRGTSWEMWGAAECVVSPDPNLTGRTGFYPRKDNFNFTNKNLLDVVGKRMLVYARLTKAGYDAPTAKLLEGFCDIEGCWVGMPEYKGDYWDKKRAKLAEFDAEKVRSIIEREDDYSEADLKRDLTEMKKIVRTALPSGVHQS